MSLFVDSSAFYAAAYPSEHNNARAKAVLQTGERLVTSDHVLVETWRLVAHRLGRPVAQRLWAGIRAGGADVETVGASDLEMAWAITQEYAEQDFSLVDCTSFAVMQRLGISRVASFDNHFAVYRFGAGRRSAFELVR